MLLGYMTFLKKALKTLPDGLRAKVKAAAGADPTRPSTAPSAAETKPGETAAAPAAAGAKSVTGAGSPSAAASRAVSAVTAAAGHLVGGIWGTGRASTATPGSGEEEEAFATSGGRGLVRELVERCLFSLPHDRGSDAVEACGSGGGGGEVLREGEVEDDLVRGRPGFAACSSCLAVSSLGWWC